MQNGDFIFRFRIGVLTAFFFYAVLSSCHTQSQVKTLMLSHHLPITHPASAALSAWAETVATESGGTLKINLFPSSQLYENTENFDAVSEGAVDLALNGLFGEVGKNPVFGALGLPYAFPTFEAVLSSCNNGLNALMDEEAQKMGVKVVGVAYVDYGQWFTTQKLLKSPEDFAGTRLRVYPGYVSDAVETLGGAAVMMPSSEVYNALQRGIVDGHIGTVASTVSGKYYEVVKYGVIGPFTNAPLHLIANLDTWNQLTPDQQELLSRTLQEMTVSLTKILKEKTLITGPAELREKGMEIHIQTPEEIGRFKTALKPVYDMFLKIAGERGQQALALMN